MSEGPNKMSAYNSKPQRGDNHLQNRLSDRKKIDNRKKSKIAKKSRKINRGTK